MKLSFVAVTSVQVCTLAPGTKGQSQHYNKRSKMSTTWTVMGILTFITLVIFQISFTANAVDEHSAYYSFSLGLYRSPGSFIFYLFICWLVIFLLKRFIRKAKGLFD